MACNDFAAFFLSDDGAVYSYGDDTTSKFGILGLGESYLQSKPTPISSLLDYSIKSLCVRYSHACALSTTGFLFIWGTGNKGQLGINGINKTTQPIKVNKGRKCKKFQSILCGYNYTAMLSSKLM